MHSTINFFPFFYVLIFFFNPIYIRPLLLSSSSDTKKFEFHSLSNGNLTLLGDSRLHYNEIALTKEGVRGNASAGVVLYEHPILFLDPHSKTVPSFYTMFAFSIQSTNGAKEAFGDGLAFLISSHNDVLGSPGYLGLVDSASLGKKKFVAVEFDTKRDAMFNDPDDNHVGVDINSLFSIKLATSSSLNVDLKSGDIITSWIDYKSNEKRLEVFLHTLNLKPIKPLLKVDIDLSNHLNKNMFVGFSAATEGSMVSTRIHQWEFTVVEFNPPPPSSPPESGRNFPNPSGYEHEHSHFSKFAICLIVGICSVLVGWFYGKKLIGKIQKSEGTNNLQIQTIRSSGGVSHYEIQLPILVDKVAIGLNIEKVLENVAEHICVKTMKSSIPLCNNLPVVKPGILTHCNALPQKTSDIDSV